MRHSCGKNGEKNSWPKQQESYACSIKNFFSSGSCYCLRKVSNNHGGLHVTNYSRAPSKPSTRTRSAGGRLAHRAETFSLSQSVLRCPSEYAKPEFPHHAIAKVSSSAMVGMRKCVLKLSRTESTLQTEVWEKYSTFLHCHMKHNACLFWSQKVGLNFEWVPFCNVRRRTVFKPRTFTSPMNHMWLMCKKCRRQPFPHLCAQPRVYFV